LKIAKKKKYTNVSASFKSENNHENEANDKDKEGQISQC
jgi:hypothetical protein